MIGYIPTMDSGANGTDRVMLADRPDHPAVKPSALVELVRLAAAIDERVDYACKAAYESEELSR